MSYLSTPTIKQKRATNGNGHARNSVAKRTLASPNVDRLFLKTPYPKQQIVDFVYCQLVSIGSSVANASFYQFRANSAYAPDFTATSGTAHQPMGWDQWATIYNEYTVMSSHIQVCHLPLGNSDTTTGYLGVLLSDLSSGGAFSAGTVNACYEHNGPRDIKPFAGVGSEPVQVELGYSLPGDVLAGFDSRSQIGGQYSALVTQSPGDTWQFQVFVGAGGASSNIAGRSVRVRLAYKVLFTSRQPLSQS